MIPWLDPADPFPPVARALAEPDGLLAAGADLSPARLLDAYRHGIFPWFSPGQPILWWSPDPRMVLLPAEIRVTRSLTKLLRAHRYEIRTDTAFETVMRACAEPRPGQNGTWIGEAMIAAYRTLNRRGIAHSVETWIDGRLAGGLYGLALGRVFFGESMFARKPNASKIALVHLARTLERRGFGLIDCQVHTEHLASMGAREIPRADFVRRLDELVNYASRPEEAWQIDDDLA